jgi:FkbM family methyltransferase
VRAMHATAAPRSAESPLVARARQFGPLDQLAGWGPVRRAGSAARLSTFVSERARFAAADVLSLPGVRRYHLLDGGRPVLLRHGTIDLWVFYEVFVGRLYEPPAVVAAALERADEPLVLDLGANIGMFGLHALSRHPRARVIAYEPEPGNAAIHRRLVELNGDDGRWRLVEAAAGPRDGSVRFMAGEGPGSHIVDGEAAGSIEVPMVDVLGEIAEADLVKMDIEGGEWGILCDPRIAQAKAIVLEYHLQGCPRADPAAFATELLTGHGFDVTPIFHEDGIGMLWATRPR